MSKPAALISRRNLLKNSAVAAAAFQIVPGYILGLNGQTAPSNKLNIAGVGVGGMGSSKQSKPRDDDAPPPKKGR